MSTDDITLEIVHVLDSIHNELVQVRKKVTDPEEKTTDQFVGDVISNLTRREHLLKNRLEKALTQNEAYSIPTDWIERVLHQIEFLQNDKATKAKVELVAGHQAAFWGVIQNIQEVLVKPDKVRLKVTKAESNEDHMKQGE